MSDRLPPCRSCGATNLQLILSLGRMPLANALLTAEQLRKPEPTYPLDLVFCPDCNLVQITETVPPELLFSHYLYFSSFSETVLQESRELAHETIISRGLNSTSLVAEIGSNDGYQLQYFVEKGIPVLGIDPARNVAEVAEAKGIPTLCEFFGHVLAEKVSQQGVSADVIIARNVLAHVADLNGFVKGLRILLKKSGVVIIEVPYLRDLIERCEFDTIYHEHLCYFTLTALDKLFRRHAMTIVQAKRLPIHGGSLRLFAVHEALDEPGDSFRTLLQEEEARQMNTLDAYLGFAAQVQRIKHSLISMLRSLKADGNRIAAYGAAAKGTVLLNYCGIGNDMIDFVVDISPHKQGLYIPGVHLGIYHPARLLKLLPKYTLLLTWNIADEILEQQSEYTRRGGRFIVPVPTPKLVGE